MTIRIMHRTPVTKAIADKNYTLLCISSRVMTVKNENSEKLDIYLEHVIDARPIE